MQALDFQLRLNRAHEGVALKDRKLFVEALNSVSDHLGCLYHFIRRYPEHCEEMAQAICTAGGVGLEELYNYAWSRLF
jgi:hypothetical protein